jgi:parallel beta helix pectate lyase-like protein
MKKNILLLLFLIPFLVNGQGLFLGQNTNIETRGKLTVEAQEEAENYDFGNLDADYFVSDTSLSVSELETLVSTGGISAGEKIAFHASNSFVTSLDINYSGTSGNPITFCTYGVGTKSKIYNSVSVANWINHSGNIYKAERTDSIKQVFINGTRAKLARTPNTGYYNITTGGTNSFTSTSLNGSFNYTGATAVMRTTPYTIYSETVSSSSSQTLNLGGTPYGNPGTGEGFFVCNMLDFLDSAGEWFYSNDTLYVWFSSVNDTASIRATTKDYGFDISGQDYIDIENLEILHSGLDAIYLDDSQYCNIDSVDIYYPDRCGFHSPLGSTSTYVDLTNSTVTGANAGAILYYGTYLDVINNNIDGTGQFLAINKTADLLDNYGTAVFTRGDNHTFRLNTIANSGYCGINWKGQNSVIRYNYINGACQMLDDGAGIYSYNGSTYSNPASANSVVDSNIVAHVYGNTDGYTNTYPSGYGIYMDNKIHDVDITNNTVGHTTNALYFHENGLVNMRYNYLYDFILAVRITGPTQDTIRFIENTVYATDRTGTNTWWTDDHPHIMFQYDSFTRSDSNSYYTHYETAPFYISSDINFSSFQSGIGDEIHSTCNAIPHTIETDSLFINPSNSAVNFTLTGTWKDLAGSTQSSPLTLQPWTSKILINE